MSREDARIIFNNVAQVAEFADQFSTKLEEALGDVLEGGAGEDRVGALFLTVVRTDLGGRLTFEWLTGLLRLYRYPKWNHSMTPTSPSTQQP